MPATLKTRSFMSKIASLPKAMHSPGSSKKKHSKRFSETASTSASSLSDSQESSCSSITFDEAQPQQRIFETLNQNEFVDNVLIDGCNDVDVVVHFYNEDTSFSCLVEEKLVKIVEQPSRNDFALYRIDASMAPYFTSKLQIDPDETTILRFKNGQLLGRISEFPTGSCYTDLQRWLKATDASDDFASLELHCE